MKNINGILAALVMCAAFVPCFISQPARASATAPSPAEISAEESKEAGKFYCTSSTQCNTICGNPGGKCVLGHCACY